jgi:hypothetical protein
VSGHVPGYRDKELKEAVAGCVLDPRGGFVFNIGEPFDIHDIEVTKISNLQSQIRVKTQSNGTHYYTVTVREHL